MSSAAVCSHGQASRSRPSAAARQCILSRTPAVRLTATASIAFLLQHSTSQMGYSSWAAESSKGGWGGWGKQGSWGSKAKGKKGIGQKGDWGWEDVQERPKEQVRTGRIWNRFQFPKAILKASAHDDGSSFVKDTKRSLADDVFLGSRNLKKLLTPDSSHLLRRPGVGVSEAAGSVQAGVDVLKQLVDVELEELASFFQDPGLQAALSQLNTHDANAQHEQKEMRAAMATLAEKLTATPRMEELATKLTIASSRLYLMGTALLPLLVCMSDPDWWVANIPESASDSKYLQEWRKHGKDATKMHKAVAALLAEQQEEEQRDRNNTASSLFKKKPTVRKASSSASPTRKVAEKSKPSSSATASSSSSKKKAKKHARKKTQDGKKAKHPKKKRARKSSTSSASTPAEHGKDKAKREKERRKAPEKEVHLSIHRIGGVSPEGKALVKEEDPVDTVQIVNESETAAAAVLRCMDAQGSKEDFQNWDIRAMNEDFVIRALDASAALAKDTPKVVLVRKGG